MGKVIDRTGEVQVNKMNEHMKIVEYNNNSDILVEFQDEYRAKVKTAYHNFKRGFVKNPYKAIYGVATSDVDIDWDDKYQRRLYDYWHSMIRRCYGVKELERNPTYKEVEVCNEWLLFSNFIVWFNENFYEVKGQQMQLDKDILNKGNKIYSPNTCIFVPKSINSLVINGKSTRGEYPIGIYYKKKNEQYCAQLNKGIVDGKRNNEYIGLFSNIESAFLAYKVRKERYIKEIADMYKDQIPTKLYNALYAWEVNIDD